MNRQFFLPFKRLTRNYHFQTHTLHIVISHHKSNEILSQARRMPQLHKLVTPKISLLYSSLPILGFPFPRNYPTGTFPTLLGNLRLSLRLWFQCRCPVRYNVHVLLVIHESLEIGTNFSPKLPTNSFKILKLLGFFGYTKRRWGSLVL